ncbi:hypothetical protein CONLIGDRAFT_639085 [Coniochaeta ligniaria NRRL 30616]|uniref:Uncharacterized protein n=1 Tax=Coniochaeta ligniaria NRRL 30616 TaxID=1408157 RepID=A0A1J7JMW0_9PEZI|nr:hypothetical protein CONLIGDRAFT_639085 [Coniochaeta ligniaria NRRL 30616]
MTIPSSSFTVCVCVISATIPSLLDLSREEPAHVRISNFNKPNMFSPVSILKRAACGARKTAFTARISTRALRCLTMGIPGEDSPKKTTRPPVKQNLSCGTANPMVYDDRTVTAELTLAPGTTNETGQRTLAMRLDYKTHVAAAKCEGGEEEETEKGGTYRQDGSVVCQAVMGVRIRSFLSLPRRVRVVAKARGSGIWLSSCP